MNRLRWHLLDAVPRARTLPEARRAQPGARAGPRRPTAAEAAGRRRVRIAREQVSQLRSLNRQIDQLQAELLELVKAHRPELLAEQGCGALAAAILIGHTAGVKQFRKHSSFGLQTGTAPIPCSSGQRTQHRLNRGGDRQLNHALHIIAITRAQHDPATKEYLARKEAEGKTTKGALRCLKRHLARRFYHLLAEPPADQQQAADGQVDPRARAARDPRASPPGARGPADQHSAQPDGLHQLDRSDRHEPISAVLRRAGAAVTAHRRRSPAANQPRSGRYRPTRTPTDAF